MSCELIIECGMGDTVQLEGHETIQSITRYDFYSNQRYILDFFKHCDALFFFLCVAENNFVKKMRTPYQSLKMFLDIFLHSSCTRLTTTHL
jgi:hypothetical protein